MVEIPEHSQKMDEEVRFKNQERKKEMTEDNTKSNVARLKGLREDYKKVFSTEEGKRVLADLEKECFGKDSTFATDPYTSAFNAGNRAVLLHIETVLTLDIEALEKMNP